MNSPFFKVAVVGSGISGAVCASKLARIGVFVTLFESARGPGGRMSQRREKTEDGKELHFDHGAPFFSVSKSEVLCLVQELESRGLVAEWKEKFGVKSKFGVSVGRVEWLDDEKLWSLTGVDGEDLGQFKGLVASDKNIVSPRIAEVTGRLPPLDIKLVPELSEKLHNLAVRPCFAVMLAFAEPLSSISVKSISFENSKLLSRAYCESSKPSRSTTSERWVLHSTAEYAEGIIAQTGLKKPSDIILNKVAEQLFQEFQSTGLNISQPFFKKAHRWGSAFPAVSIAQDEKCLWDKNKRLAICGDFCVSPNVEGAIESGLAAALRLEDSISCL